jgi:glyoxylase-like metal-dependent hydrolase (beta-lactamase superfamily II)
MSLDRRRFLQLGAGAAAFGVTGSALSQRFHKRGEGRARALQATERSPSTHRFRLGAMEITVINDGRFVLPTEVFAPDVERQERERFFAARHLPLDGIPVQLCPVLIETGTERILVDTGMGAPPEIAPDSGWLPSRFRTTGTEPEAIDLVVLTHFHEDHYGGLMDPATARSRFPNADVVVARAELEFWTNPDVAPQNPDLAETYGGTDAFEGFVAKTVEVLNAVGDRLRPIGPAEEIARGVHILDSAGHTAGHIAVLAESEGEQLLLAGDAITNVHVAFEHPRWRFLYDDYGEQAIRTRERLLERAATEGLLLSGYHFPFPAVGRVFPDRGAYRWLPGVVG